MEKEKKDPENTPYQQSTINFGGVAGAFDILCRGDDDDDFDDRPDISDADKKRRDNNRKSKLNQENMTLEKIK